MTIRLVELLVRALEKYAGRDIQVIRMPRILANASQLDEQVGMLASINGVDKEKVVQRAVGYYCTVRECTNKGYSFVALKQEGDEITLGDMDPLALVK